MRNKDALMLEGCYKKIQGQLINEEVGNAEFKQEINLDYINSEQKDRELVSELDVYKNKLVLKYKIDMEFRSWGLKEIQPYAMKLESFTLTKMNDDFQEQIVKKFEETDLSQAQIEKEKGDGLYPTSIVLFLDSDLNIVPEKCTVNFN